MKYFHKPETWQSLYSRLLSKETPFRLTLEDSSRDELQACKELLDNDFMIGDVVWDPSSSGGYDLDSVDILEITLKGRIFGGEQAKLIKEASFMGRAKMAVFFILGWIGSLLLFLTKHYLTKGG